MTTPRYAVFGNPIAHSRSPQIHRLFAKQEGTYIEYRRITADIDRNSFACAIETFFGAGANGANVTVPFKEYAFDLADEHSNRAQTAGAANTLIALPNGKLRADNTDGAGLVCDLQNHCDTDLNGAKVLLLGAGGAARGVISPLLAAGARLTLANRSHDKALALAQRFDIEALPFDVLNGGFDIVINATSGSLHGNMPAVPSAVFADCRLAYDMAYGEESTVFMDFAAQNGAAATADGLGMLVCQAAESYRLWRGFSPATAEVIDALRHRRLPLPAGTPCDEAEYFHTPDCG